ncbi:ganglioside induced differentiation associated protein 2 [Tieghemostelium lacteum]|uniref:Ganglioside induced differentiation associated protein 2 n=1 Tax=Tieghemostelium lacteum TaxID=361077 RepID=A0A151Z6G0_TIELA|nr:ganglioside induced differentiation associated protein 2 [Tieghemostelium lacteum]|eukprot:KYQ89551.1 ganglioside induced differentiation associated protein 2 [Tieghemostelium lacteum]
MEMDLESQINDCKYGDALITCSGKLPCKYVIHCVCPTFNHKYISASENALNSCYRTAFNLLNENSLSTIAFSCIHSDSKFPVFNGANIALRTIRRFLEKPYSKSVERVIICVGNITELDIYQKMMPVYFPRTTEEEMYSQQNIPNNCGDENGESTDFDRKIKDLPDFMIKSMEEEERLENEQYTLYGGDLKSSKQSFCEKKEDPDRRRINSLLAKTDKELERDIKKDLYKVYIERSKQLDFIDEVQMNFINQSQDTSGNPVVVIFGENIHTKNADMTKVFLYCIKILQQCSVTGKQFSIVYFHSNVSGGQQSPDFKWFRKVLEFIDSQYLHQIKELICVHPSFAFKAMISLLKTFTKLNVLNHLKYHENLSSINSYISRSSLPKSIFSHEFKSNNINDFSFETNDEYL